MKRVQLLVEVVQKSVIRAPQDLQAGEEIEYFSLI